MGFKGVILFCSAAADQCQYNVCWSAVIICPGSPVIAIPQEDILRASELTSVPDTPVFDAPSHILSRQIGILLPCATQFPL